MQNKDVAIIGAGPAGISCALYLARANVDFVWLEKGAPGGKLINIAEIDNYPGIPNASGIDLALKLLDSTNAYGVHTTYGDVSSIKKDNDLFVVDAGKEQYAAKAVVVAAGLANVATIKGEKNLIGKGVSYCATCDGPLYKGKVAIVYGDDEKALEEALYLSNLVSTVYLINPEDSFKDGFGKLEKAKAIPNISIEMKSKITEILGENHVESVSIEDGDAIKCDVIFPLMGEKSASMFLSPLGVTTENGFILVNDDMESDVKGVFACGDVIKKKLRQVSTAVGDGANASSGVIKYLRGLSR